MEAEKQLKEPISRKSHSRSGGGNMSFVDNRPQVASQTKLIQSIQKKENKTGLLDDLKTGVENLPGSSAIVQPQISSIFAPIQLMKIQDFNKAIERLEPKIIGKAQSDFKKWISTKTGKIKPYEGVVDEDDLKSLYISFVNEKKSLEETVLQVDESPRLQQSPILLTYEYLYAGNLVEPMKSKTISLRLLIQDIQDGNMNMLLSYIDKIKTNSVSPNANMLIIRTNERELTCSANPKKLFEALKIIIELNREEIQSIAPIPVDYIQTIGELCKLTTATDSTDFEMGLEEKQETLAMDAQGVDDIRDSSKLNELYQHDSITVFMAMKLNGRIVNNDKLLMINRIIQTSGTNQELRSDTASKAGKIRTSPIDLADGIHLEDPLNIPAALDNFEVCYNRFLIKIKEQKPNGDVGSLHFFYRNALLFHQQFIQIHPFSNGNGRVARVLFYNLLIAAGLPLFRLNPNSDTFKAMSGMHLKGVQSTKRLTNYIMGLHIEYIKEHSK